MVELVSAIEAIRKRPGMYVGDVCDDSGFHHLLDEVVNNALNEAWAGHCDSIQIDLNTDGSAVVTDNGRGIPTETWRGESVPYIIMTQLHAGGKFDQSTTEKPLELSGVGVVVVNALSEKFEVRISQAGAEHYMSFRRGMAETPLTLIGTTDRQGTAITFRPDPEIFRSLKFDIEQVQRRLRSLAHLNLGVTVSILDNRGAQVQRVTIDV